jgi:hypothetical protein
MGDEKKLVVNKDAQVVQVGRTYDAPLIISCRRFRVQFSARRSDVSKFRIPAESSEL